MIKSYSYLKNLNGKKVCVADKDHDLALATHLGTPLNSRNLLPSFYRIRDQAKLPKICFHDTSYACYIRKLSSRGLNMCILVLQLTSIVMYSPICNERLLIDLKLSSINLCKTNRPNLLFYQTTL